MMLILRKQICIVKLSYALCKSFKVFSPFIHSFIYFAEPLICGQFRLCSLLIYNSHFLLILATKKKKKKNQTECHL